MDEAVQTTNDDACACKAYAVQRGYWKDPFIRIFARAVPHSKTPEISRGYFARTEGVRSLISNFLKQIELSKAQIVSLGAGFDTLFWRLSVDGLVPRRFVEIDFPQVTSRKCAAIKRNPSLLEHLYDEDIDVEYNPTDLHSGSYNLVGVDLKNLSSLEKKLLRCGLKFDLPTVFIAECVLVYMEADRSRELLTWISSHFSSAAFVNYEQVNMKDKFGHVMVENLAQRHCALSGVSFCESEQSQKQRFLDAGWNGVEVWDMNHVYRSMPPAEIQRVEEIDFLDEKELLEQLLSHYCICWAWTDTQNLGFDKMSL